jgi:hypothetical protein
MRRFVCIPFAVVALLVAPVSALAGNILLGAGSLFSADDLTRIQTDKGVLEFLDLRATNGMSVDGALAAYGGFRWVNEPEATALFDAFGIVYASAYNTDTPLVHSPGAPERFVAYLGTALPGLANSLGFIDDRWSVGQFWTYACVGPSCSYGGFTSNRWGFPGMYVVPPYQGFGVFLVRDAPPSGVPDSASTLLLFATGLGGLGVLRLRLH